MSAPVAEAFRPLRVLRSLVFGLLVLLAAAFLVALALLAIRLLQSGYRLRH